MPLHAIASSKHDDDGGRDFVIKVQKVRHLNRVFNIRTRCSRVGGDNISGTRAWGAFLCFNICLENSMVGSGSCRCHLHPVKLTWPLA